MIRRLKGAAAVAVVLCTAVAAAPIATQLDWDSVVWPNGSLSETYTVGNGDVSLQWTGSTSSFIAGRPQIAQSETGGLIPPEDALSLWVNFNSDPKEVVLTIDFTHPGGVTDVSFTVFDVDGWQFVLNRYADQIQVTATNGTGQIDPSNVTVVNPAYVSFDGVNTVTGIQSVSDSDAPDGNVTFEFNQAGITQVQFAYRSPPGLYNNPGIQFISIHDINFTYNEPVPELTISKTVETLSDPFNGGSFPKAVPGATVTYTIGVSNAGDGAVDAGTVEVTDPIPGDTALVVSDFDGSNPGPVAFVDGVTPSGLTYTFTSLASTTDDIEFSSDGGASYNYTPSDSGDGTDPAVTHIRINPQGSLAASTGIDPGFELLYNVQVR